MSTFTTHITPPPQFKRKYIEDDDGIILDEEPHIQQQNDNDMILKKNLKDEIDQNTEWPQFIHPEGGIIKITPWGSLRQYQDPNTGESLTKFEDFSFDDFNKSVYSLEKFEKIYQQHQYCPDTPRSITTNSNINRDEINYSPSGEVESYVIDGYRNNENNHLVQFQQEHENYFGMNGEDQEEYDISYQSNNNEDDEMN